MAEIPGLYDRAGPWCNVGSIQGMKGVICRSCQDPGRNIRPPYLAAGLFDHSVHV